MPRSGAMAPVSGPRPPRGGCGSAPSGRSSRRPAARRAPCQSTGCSPRVSDGAPRGDDRRHSATRSIRVRIDLGYSSQTPRRRRCPARRSSRAGCVDLRNCGEDTCRQNAAVDRRVADVEAEEHGEVRAGTGFGAELPERISSRVSAARSLVAAAPRAGIAREVDRRGKVVGARALGQVAGPTQSAPECAKRELTASPAAPVRLAGARSA